ncbi:stage II sporulation protein M [Paenibacillus kandeliae]|uniref:stage II sporulation protein M n=1 Tax=Paenibacillus kandeliae TaxID=3231269 RepID=UPI00345922AE
MLSFRTFWHDLKNNSSMLILATVLFVLGMILGVIMVEPLGAYLQSQLQQLRGISQQLQSGNHVELNYFLFIFFNNAIKSIFIIFLGIFFGVIPVIFLVMNGMVIGYLLHVSALQGANLAELIFKGLLPHGIIEIPAILIASAYGLKFGKLILDSMTTWNTPGRERLKKERRHFLRSTLPASLWIVIMLLVAAVIESTITYWLMQA